MKMNDLAIQLAKQYVSDLDSNFQDHAFEDFLAGWEALVDELEILGYNVDELALGGEFIPRKDIK